MLEDARGANLDDHSHARMQVKRHIPPCLSHPSSTPFKSIHQQGQYTTQYVSHRDTAVLRC